MCTGHGWKHIGELAEDEVVVPDIRAAAEWILARCRGPRQLEGGESRIADAAEALRGGRVVAFPTETVYGLGANAFDRAAVQRVFKIKNRPHYDPLIVHVADARQVGDLVRDFPAEARMLARRFWPGPMTLVLPKIDRLPDLVTAGLPTVDVGHPWLAEWESVLRDLRKGEPSIVREVHFDEKWYHQTIHFVDDAQRIRIYGADTPRARKQRRRCSMLTPKLKHVSSNGRRNSPKPTWNWTAGVD